MIHTQTSRSVDESLANLFDIEDSWGFDIIPEKAVSRENLDFDGVDIPVFS
jgi:hypothetical protein